MPKKILWALAAALVSIHCASAATAPKPVEATLTIHADEPGAKIDANIYGQFMEHLGRNVYEGIWVGENSPIPNTRGFRNDTLAALKKLKVPVLRWPGGCFADEYHWRDGIGPRNKRPTKINTNWGGDRFNARRPQQMTEQPSRERQVSLSARGPIKAGRTSFNFNVSGNNNYNSNPIIAIDQFGNALNVAARSTNEQKGFQTGLEHSLNANHGIYFNFQRNETDRINNPGGFTYHHCAIMKITADPSKPLDTRWPAQRTTQQ